MWWAGFILTFILVFVEVRTNCPHDDLTLEKFSTVYGSTLSKDTKVVINKGILMDVTDLDVDSIEIIDEGSLVFNQGHDINIKTKGIYVKDNGGLIIGSESCRHADNINIELEGTRTVDRSTLGQEGEKFIAVTGNGNLQIHGEDRLSWTKLSGTVDRFNANADTVYYRHMDTADFDKDDHKKGFGIHILDSNLELLSYSVFGMPTDVSKLNKAILKMTNKLKAANEGEIVAVSVQNKLTNINDGDSECLYETIETLAGMTKGELLLRQQIEYDSFSVVFVVEGGKYDQSLDQQVGKRDTEATSAIVYKNKKVTAVSFIMPKRKDKSYVDLRVLNPEVGSPEVTVTHNISSWRRGDKILLTSSDYAFNHGEVRIIKDITGEKSFTITHELNYRHFGEVESGVDMRAEVALLSRNIRISGVQQRGCPKVNKNCKNKQVNVDMYGGHIIIFDSFKSVTIQGAELTFMGQTMDKGHNPVHFHVCKNITGKNAIIKRNSIHHTYRRAITVHDTFGTSVEAPGVQILENVAYLNFGHTFVLEDGAEAGTIIRGNLGAETTNVENDFDTDLQNSTTYRITNANVVMVDNVAAGSEGFGIWYTFPLEPVGLSEGMVYGYNEAKHTALWTFDNNVVHSNEKGGFNFDFILKDEDSNIAGCIETRQDPFDENSQGVKVQINRMTAYKNRDINVWLRGEWGFEISQLSSAESKKGIELARGSVQTMKVTKSIFIGKSKGNSEDSSYPGGVTPTELGQMLGIIFNDGPTFFDRCWFTGFGNDGTYISAAIGFAPKQMSHSSIVSTVRDMRFGFVDGEEGNRVFDGLPDASIQGIGDLNVDDTATILDVDGSVSLCPADQYDGTIQLLKPGASSLTDRCTFRNNWNMAACKDIYGKISVTAMDVIPGWNIEDCERAGQMRRRRFDDDTEMFVEEMLEAAKKTQYMVIISREEHYYEFQYLKEFPVEVRFNGYGVEKMLYFRLSSKKVRDKNWDRQDTDHCPGEYCPRVSVEMLKTFDYTPCYTATEAQKSISKAMESVQDLDCTLPASQPEEDWGARDTLLSEDGYWGQWTGWSECCNEVGGDVVERTRYRLCDDPAPRGSGADCRGESLQSEPCPSGCPVDGHLTDWSDWSECYCDGIAEGSIGVKSKEKDCADIANGGNYCKGSLIRYATCENFCGTRTCESVDGALSQWGEWTECFCNGIAQGSRGAMTRTRTCNGAANYGDFCGDVIDEVRPCDADCFSDQ